MVFLPRNMDFPFFPYGIWMQMVPGGYWYPPSATSRANENTSCGSWCSALETHGLWRGKHHPQGTPKRWFCMKKIKDEARCAYLSKQLWKYIYRHPLMVRRITFRTYISDHKLDPIYGDVTSKTWETLTHQMAKKPIHGPSMAIHPLCPGCISHGISMIVSYIHGISLWNQILRRDWTLQVVLPRISEKFLRT